MILKCTEKGKGPRMARTASQEEQEEEQEEGEEEEEEEGACSPGPDRKEAGCRHRTMSCMVKERRAHSHVMPWILTRKT